MDLFRLKVVQYNSIQKLIVYMYIQHTGRAIDLKLIIYIPVLSEITFSRCGCTGCLIWPNQLQGDCVTWYFLITEDKSRPAQISTVKCLQRNVYEILSLEKRLIMQYYQLQFKEAKLQCPAFPSSCFQTHLTIPMNLYLSLILTDSFTENIQKTLYTLLKNMNIDSTEI